MKILKEFNDIEKSVRRNNTVTIGLISLFGLMIIVFGVLSYKLTIYFSNHQLILESDGEVRNTHPITSQEAKIIEIKDHMARFYGSFYSFDQYNMNEKINAGLWLGDESLRKLYTRYKNDNWYNNIIQYNINQTSEIKNFVKVDVSVYPYQVVVTGEMMLRQGDKIEKFSLNGTCQVEETSRDFPRNPHGLFIRNWIEESTKPIQ